MKTRFSEFYTFLVIAAALIVGACNSNPVSTAETFQQKAFALYGSYVIFQGKAAELAQDSATPAKVKTALSAADKAAYPVAESLVDAALEVGRVQDLLAKCPTLPEPDPTCVPTNEQKLATALTNLSSIYFSAQPVLLNLINAVKEAK